LEVAIKLAVEYCIANNILKEYLESRGAEVLGMLFSQLKAEGMKDVWKTDGKIEDARKMLQRNFSFDVIADITGLPLDKIKSINIPKAQIVKATVQK